MDSCDVLIVGGGPAGSSCAWGLRNSGLDVVILDKSRFPRPKVCGGWITPAVFEDLDLDPDEYARSRVLQPITGFRTSRMGESAVETRYGRSVSYGIRRCEFDDFLVRRSKARLIEDTPLKSLEPTGSQWIANNRLEANLVVGAGGHFCPVARFLGAKLGAEPVVAAQEIEFPMDERQLLECSIRPEIPELYFCPDMKGYGWCFRKGDFLNVGLGRMDRHELSRHVDAFVHYLKRSGKIPQNSPASLAGHAYLLYDRAQRKLVSDGVVLIGDSAGLAYAQSGEGIRPAIESGLLAARVIQDAAGNYGCERLNRYRTLLVSHFGELKSDWTSRFAQLTPSVLMDFLSRKLMATAWFARHVVIERWFLRLNE